MKSRNRRLHPLPADWEHDIRGAEDKLDWLDNCDSAEARRVNWLVLGLCLSALAIVFGVSKLAEWSGAW